jgi:hypothetical protein
MNLKETPLTHHQALEIIELYRDLVTQVADGLFTQAEADARFERIVMRNAGERSDADVQADLEARRAAR